MELTIPTVNVSAHKPPAVSTNSVSVMFLEKNLPKVKNVTVPSVFAVIRTKLAKMGDKKLM
jgi:hypothetical protein